ncbi:hypothetical protein D9611_011526 [Ephemerocybe angulata]|uniref:Uncharacterized protein n=1 Tax=Ephemerocybe angulata TaxID=980116 RepID=A0A8H5AUU3_9AGAR|nr:hypothetical protein D9611_011526 [Tulosesus angulatus]
MRTSADPPKRPLAIRYIPDFLLSDAMRLWCLRWTIGTSIIAVYYSAYICAVLGKFSSWYGLSLDWALFFLVLSIVTLVHHIASAFKEVLVLPMALIDAALTLGELGCFLYINSRFMIMKYQRNVEFDWFPKRAIFGLVSLLVLTICLVFLLALKVIDLASKNAGRPSVANARRGFIEPPTAWWKYPRDVLVGRGAWVEKLPGEAFWVRLLRGTVAVFMLLIIITFATYAIILKPVAEMGMTPNKEYRAEGLPSTFTLTTTPVWYITLVWPLQVDAPKHIINVSTVGAVWSLPEGTESNPICSPVEETLSGQPWTQYYDIISFMCDRPQVPGRRDDDTSFPVFSNYSDYVTPDLELTVDFSELYGPKWQAGSNANRLWDTLQIFVGLTANVEEMLNATQPALLFPGTHMLGSVGWFIRQRLDPDYLATIGYELHKTFLVTKVAQMTINPFIADFAAPERGGPNISTLSIMKAPPPFEFTVVQDYRSDSVLTGLASVGGLSSFFSTFLAIWLGASLMGTLLGIKPYSPFGILHGMDKEQKNIATECRAQYPMLRDDIAALRIHRSRGLIAFLFDTLIDIKELNLNEDGRSLSTYEKLDDGAVEEGLQELRRTVSNSAMTESEGDGDTSSLAPLVEKY